MLIYAGWLAHRAPKRIAKAQTVGRAFNGVAVLLFVGLVGSFSIASELLIRWIGAPGALVGAAVMGFADAHAASVSMATLFAGERLAVAAAAIGVALTLTTNMAVKIPTAFIAGSRSYGRHVTIGVGLLLAGFWLGGLLAASTGATAPAWIGPAH